MKKIILHLPEVKSRDYYIFIGSNLLEKIDNLFPLDNYSKVLIVTDKDIKKLFSKKLLDNLPIESSFIILPSGEKAKNIDNVQKIWTAMKNSQLDRKSLVINLGGGIIGDMGGFAASTFMRGLNFINIPTTLLSQVDASVGGKTGFDFDNIKNLIGTFNQPSAVIVDTNMLVTLPKREFISGFAEIIKHGLVADKKHFERVTSKPPLKFSKNELIEIISKAVELKGEIVEADPTESGKRKILNFGHTIGHAIESLSLETETPLLHGEAVSIGMLAEAKISQLLKLITLQDLQLIRQVLVNADLPINREGIDTSKIIKKIQSDKKNKKGKTNWTLLQGIGQAVYDQQVPESIVKQALEYVGKGD